MRDDDNLERRLESWLEATAKPMPPEVLEDVMSTVSRVRPAGVQARFGSGRRWQLAAGLVVAVVLAVGIGAALRMPAGPGGPTSTPQDPPGSAGAAPATAPASAAAGASAPATATPGAWHRNNYNAGVERLACQEGVGIWTCEYIVSDGTGSFLGQLVTDSWTCPVWFANAICDDVTAVYRGYFEIANPAGGATPEVIRQEYVITEVDGQPVLQLYWTDRFVCPWYRTLEAAMAADYVCVFAP
jgi:hypothetical protein